MSAETDDAERRHYKTAHASISRSIRLLERRGLVVRYRRHDSAVGLHLTDTGRCVAKHYLARASDPVFKC